MRVTVLTFCGIFIYQTLNGMLRSDASTQPDIPQSLCTIRFTTELADLSQIASEELQKLGALPAERETSPQTQISATFILPTIQNAQTRSERTPKRRGRRRKNAGVQVVDMAQKSSELPAVHKIEEESSPAKMPLPKKRNVEQSPQLKGMKCAAPTEKQRANNTTSAAEAKPLQGVNLGKTTGEGSAVQRRYFGGGPRIPDKQTIDLLQVVNLCRASSANQEASVVRYRCPKELAHVPEWMWTMDLNKDLSDAVPPDVVQNGKSDSCAQKTEDKKTGPDTPSGQARKAIDDAKAQAGWGDRGYRKKSKYLESVLTRPTTVLGDSASRKKAGTAVSGRAMPQAVLSSRGFTSANTPHRVDGYKDLHQQALSQSKEYLNHLKGGRPSQGYFRPTAIRTPSKNAVATRVKVVPPPPVSWAAPHLSFSQKPRKI